MFKKRRGRHSSGAREERCLLPASSGVRVENLFLFHFILFIL
jgi:hypothetical protein